MNHTPFSYWENGVCTQSFRNFLRTPRIGCLRDLPVYMFGISRASFVLLAQMSSSPLDSYVHKTLRTWSCSWERIASFFHKLVSAQLIEPLEHGSLMGFLESIQLHWVHIIIIIIHRHIYLQIHQPLFTAHNQLWILRTKRFLALFKLQFNVKRVANRNSGCFPESPTSPFDNDSRWKEVHIEVSITVRLVHTI